VAALDRGAAQFRLLLEMALESRMQGGCARSILFRYFRMVDDPLVNGVLKVTAAFLP
jgi:hypothetical protein